MEKAGLVEVSVWVRVKAQDGVGVGVGVGAVTGLGGAEVRHVVPVRLADSGAQVCHVEAARRRLYDL